jgi:hypothetical protein
MKLAIKSRGMTCSQGKGRLPHKPQGMVPVSTTVKSGTVKLQSRKGR